MKTAAAKPSPSERRRCCRRKSRWPCCRSPATPTTWRCRCAADTCGRNRANALNLTKNFTVELWAKFEAVRPSGAILLSKGDPQKGNWHFIQQSDGTVQANIFGQAPVYLFSPESGGPVPGAWYHLAAVFEDHSPGKTRIRTFVNGHPRGGGGRRLDDADRRRRLVHRLVRQGRSSVYRDARRGADHAGGARAEIVSAGGHPGDCRDGRARASRFSWRRARGSTPRLRAKADGAPIVRDAAGISVLLYRPRRPRHAVNLGLPPAGYDPAFATAMQAFNMSFAATGSGYHFAVKPGDRFVVAVGYWDPVNKPGHQVQKVVVDGQVVDTVDPAGDGRGKPFVRLYPASDRTGDGLLEVFVRNQQGRGEERLGTDEPDLDLPRGRRAAAWTPTNWPAAQSRGPDLLRFVRPRIEVPRTRRLSRAERRRPRGRCCRCGRWDSTACRAVRSRPTRSTWKSAASWPIGSAPIWTAGAMRARDDGDRHPLGFSSDCGYEVAGSSIETIYLLGRLMRRDFDLKVPFDALLQKQDSRSKFPGAFVGGEPCRTGFIWGQGTIFSGLMAYHELTGDPRALAAAEQLADWYGAYLNNRRPRRGQLLPQAREQVFTRGGHRRPTGRRRPGADALALLADRRSRSTSTTRERIAELEAHSTAAWPG